MRCNNCGWNNPDNLHRCEKCNAPLQGSMVANDNASPQRYAEEQNNMAKTVQGQTPDLPYIDQPNLPVAATDCPFCGYPGLPAGVTRCPKCGQEIGAQKGRLEAAKPSLGGTIDPYLIQNQARFRLQPMPREGEVLPTTKEFSGTAVNLNRENLDPGNKSITSSVQASITNIGGKWFIEDKSALKTTYKHIEGLVEMKKGDIVIMGDRKFVFDC